MSSPSEDPRWKIISIDACPSHSDIEIEEYEGRILWMLKVSQIGAVLLSSRRTPAGRWEFSGVSIYTLDDIRRGL